MMRILALLLSTLLATAAVVRGEDEQLPIGLVKTVTGEAHILRAGRRMAAQPGTQLVRGDSLSTGATGTMGVILRDDTILSLGPATETRIEQFNFEPTGQKLAMVVRVARGVIEYLSGRIAKLAPGAVRLETPTATLGVRGTHLLVRVVP
jgi:hypothetical protein